MNDQCEICNGPREAGPLPGPHFCGYCLELHVAALHRREELSASIAAALFQEPGDSGGKRPFPGLENAVKLAAAVQLGPHEQAAEIWARVSRLPNPMAGLSRLSEHSDLTDAVRLVEARSEHLALLAVLAGQTSEADVCTFLAQRQHLLRATLGCYHPGDTAVCRKEFQFGAHFRADFLLLYPRRSLSPILYFVEFEPVADLIFTKKGTPSARLLGALKQIREWYAWSESNRPYFHRMLLDTFGGELDPLYLEASLRRDELHIESFIVIGRRLASDRDYRGLWSDAEHRLTIHSHDTLLDVAAGFDADRFEAEAEWESRKRIRASRSHAG
jgi:hypothetical protein